MTGVLPALGGLGAMRGVTVDAEGAGATERNVADGEPQQIRLEANGWMPNNERLPVLMYRDVLRASGEGPRTASGAAKLPDSVASADAAATWAEALFTRNGWPPQWRNGVYPFHHYHSTAHEVLGFVAGEAKLVLGGDGGREMTMRAGDVLVLPAGTGHCELSCSRDFLVVGAYPPGQHWDICRTAPDAKAVERMRRLRFPASDPVLGRGGTLSRVWRAGG